jgi:CarboxypepD_reg-like domain
MLVLKATQFINRYLLLLILAVPMVTLGQIGSVYRLAGVVLDKKTRKPIPGATIVIKSINVGSLVDKKGRFLVGAREYDTLIVKLIGHYDTQKVPIPSMINAPDTLVVLMDQEVHTLQEVVITEDKFVPYVNTSVSKYKSSSSSNKLQMPSITSIYEQFSKKHQNFKKVEAMVQNDERQWYVMKRLTYKRLKTMVPIPEKDYYDFIEYCHFSKRYILSATDYELIIEVKRLYADFTDTAAPMISR